MISKIREAANYFISKKEFEFERIREFAHLDIILNAKGNDCKEIQARIVKRS